MKINCDKQKYGCEEELNKSEFERHVKYCPFNTCETCETRKVFGTEHNCLQVLKSRIDGLTEEKTEFIEQNKRNLEEYQNLNKINHNLGEKNSQLTEENIGLKNEIEILRKRENQTKTLLNTNTRINSDLNVAQNEIIPYISELDQSNSEKRRAENIQLKEKLNIVSSQLEKLKEQNVIAELNLPVFEKSGIASMSQQDLDELSCGICQNILVNPVVLSCCRQTYCRTCIEEWLKRHNTCPDTRLRTKKTLDSRKTSKS